MRQTKNKASTPISEKIDRARKNSQTKLALDLAHELAKSQPTPEHQDLLRQVMYERGIALVAEKKPMEAMTVFQNTAKLGGPSEFRQTLAESLAKVGSIAQALEIARAAEDASGIQKILGHAADFFITRPPSAPQPELPPDFVAGKEAIRKAFEFSEQGKDEEARTQLQSIGLASPFLEWKILLRGLLAYYQNDNAKAIENWQRLDPNRLPYKMASIPRCQIDSAYRTAQTPEAQKVIDRKLGQLHTGVGKFLRELRKEVGHGKNLHAAFRLVEQFLPAMKQSHPQLIDRLQQFMRATIIRSGGPSDMQTYLRTFGAPREDPALARVISLAQEQHGILDEAILNWRAYTVFVETSTGLWSPEKKNLILALLWEHIGKLAEEAEETETDDYDDFEDVFIFRRPKKKPAKKKKEAFDAISSLKKSIEFCPDRLAPRLGLFKAYLRKHKSKEAHEVGLKLLERFPGHSETLEELGGLCLQEGQFAEAVAYFEQAVRGDAFKQRLRDKLACASQNLASDLGLAKKWDQAREHLDTALKYAEASRVEIRCARAVLELKAKEPEIAQQILAELHALPNQRLTVPFALVGESVRLKLPPAEKKRIQAEWNEARQSKAAPAEILELLGMMARQKEVRVQAYAGQKAREKEARKLLEDISYDVFDERSFEKLVMSFVGMQMESLTSKAVRVGREKFPKNIRLRLIEIERELTREDGRLYRVERDLADVTALVQALPRGEEQEQYLEKIRQLREDFAKAGAMMSEMMNYFGDIFGRR